MEVKEWRSSSQGEWSQINMAQKKSSTLLEVFKLVFL